MVRNSAASFSSPHLSIPHAKGAGYLYRRRPSYIIGPWFGILVAYIASSALIHADTFHVA